MLEQPKSVFGWHLIKHYEEEENKFVSMNDFEEGVLKAVGDEGMNLFLVDGTKWYINPGDISTVLTWVSGAKLRITTVNEESFYCHRLYHTETGSSVRARKDQ